MASSFAFEVGKDGHLIGTQLAVERWSRKQVTECLFPRRTSMLVLSEKNLPPRRSQIFYDPADEDPALQEHEDGWVEHFIQRLVDALRRIGPRK